MAWRNIWRNKWRSVVIMLSVALGLFSGLAVLSLYQAMMKSRIRTLIETETGHIQIHHRSFKEDMDPRYILSGSGQLDSLLHQLPQIRQVARRSAAQGMLSSATGSAGIQIYGIHEAEERRVSQLGKKIREGRGFGLSEKPEILIGKKLARKLKLRTGSRVVLTVTDTASTLVSGAFKVVGIYESDNAPLDERNAYIPFPVLNNLLQTGPGVHEIALLLHRDEEVAAVVEQLRPFAADGLVESWQELSPETELMSRTVDELSYIIIIIILIALSFGIINTMLMAVLERTREIGMMIALGTTRYRIFVIVLFETLLLTLLGTPVGIGMAQLVIAYYHHYGLDLSGMGKDLMSSFGYQTLFYPEFPLEKLPGVMTIVMITALLSAILPSIKALRLQPADALKK